MEERLFSSSTWLRKFRCNKNLSQKWRPELQCAMCAFVPFHKCHAPVVNGWLILHSRIRGLIKTTAQNMKISFHERASSEESKEKYMHTQVRKTRGRQPGRIKVCSEFNCKPSKEKRNKVLTFPPPPVSDKRDQRVFSSGKRIKNREGRTGSYLQNRVLLIDKYTEFLQISLIRSSADFFPSSF